MFSTILVIAAIWFFGSIPLGLLVARVLGKLNTTPEFEHTTATVVAEPQLSL